MRSLLRHAGVSRAVAYGVLARATAAVSALAAMTLIAARFAPYVDWLNHPEVLTIHFEDLINARTATLTRIMDHFLTRASLPSTRQLILDSLESSINPSRSPTFRSGKTGEWKQHFTEEHKKIFKDIAGDLLIKLGYEKNNAW